MNQCANIFHKDLHYLRSHLVIPLAALLLFTVLEAGNWTSGPLLFFSLPAVSLGLALLFCLSWVVLIVSLVQAERLVGLNQFWTTRPYEWPKLMMAKCYFILLLLYLPLILSQIVLLASAHLSVLHAIWLLVFNLLLFTATVVLPAWCAAALTRTTNQAMMILLGMLSVFIAAVSIARSVNGLIPRWLIPSQVGFCAAITFTALINQYRSRATRRSIQILALAPMLILATESIIPGSTLAATAYPFAGQNLPIAVRFDGDPLRTPPRAVVGDRHAELFLHTPLLLSALQPDTTYFVDAHRVVLKGQDGVRWNSPWISVSDIIKADPASPERTADSQFPLPTSVYERLHGRPVSLRVEFALTEFRDQAPIGSRLSTGGEMVPNLGFCTLDNTYSQIKCRSSFREPLPFAVSTVRKDGPCTAPEAATEPVSANVGKTASLSVVPHVSSVVETPLRLTPPRKLGYLCPGLPIEFVELRFQRRFQLETPPVNVNLNDYISAMQLR